MRICQSRNSVLTSLHHSHSQMPETSTRERDWCWKLLEIQRVLSGVSKFKLHLPRWAGRNGQCGRHCRAWALCLAPSPHDSLRSSELMDALADGLFGLVARRLVPNISRALGVSEPFLSHRLFDIDLVSGSGRCSGSQVWVRVLRPMC